MWICVVNHYSIYPMIANEVSPFPNIFPIFPHIIWNMFNVTVSIGDSSRASELGPDISHGFNVGIPIFQGVEKHS